MGSPNIAYLLGDTQAGISTYFEAGTLLALTQGPDPKLTQYLATELAQLQSTYPAVKRDLARVAAVLRVFGHEPPKEPKMPTDFPVWTQAVSKQVHAALEEDQPAFAHYLLGYVLGDATATLRVLVYVSALLGFVPQDKRLRDIEQNVLEALERGSEKLSHLALHPAFSGGMKQVLSQMVPCVNGPALWARQSDSPATKTVANTLSDFLRLRKQLDDEREKA
ncbi:MAG TPA: hypothetical protein PKE31_04160 [Pseudomonadota bacterium]|nr:hypothetical protein [Pseudomonadota bacterium]